MVLKQLQLPQASVPDIYSFISKDTLEGLLLQTEDGDTEELEALYQKVKQGLDCINS